MVGRFLRCSLTISLLSDFTQRLCATITNIIIIITTSAMTLVIDHLLETIVQYLIVNRFIELDDDAIDPSAVEDRTMWTLQPPTDKQARGVQKTVCLFMFCTMNMLFRQQAENKDQCGIISNEKKSAERGSCFAINAIIRHKTIS